MHKQKSRKSQHVWPQEFTDFTKINSSKILKISKFEQIFLTPHFPSFFFGNEKHFRHSSFSSLLQQRVIRRISRYYPTIPATGSRPRSLNANPCWPKLDQKLVSVCVWGGHAQVTHWFLGHVHNKFNNFNPTHFLRHIRYIDESNWWRQKCGRLITQIHDLVTIFVVKSFQIFRSSVYAWFENNW